MLKKIQAELDNLTARQSLKSCVPSSSRLGGYVTYKGKELLDFTSWDFFNLHENPIIKRAAQFEIESVGIGTGSSRLMTGTFEGHIRCEERIAKFLGTEAAVLFSSKNQAVLSLVVSLLDESCLAIVEEELQSPVIDACYLVNAGVKTFSAQKPNELEEILKESSFPGDKLVFVESVSPLTGNKIALREVFSVVERFGAELVIDESFALGIAGARGAGESEIDLAGKKIISKYGELSLTIGSYGAFVACSVLLKDYLVNRSKTFQSEASIPTAICEATIAGIDLLELMPLAREKLLFVVSKLRDGLENIGVVKEVNSSTPIVSIPFSKYRLARDFREALIEKGFLVDALCKTGMLTESGIARILVNSAHSEQQIESLLNAVFEIYPRLS